MKLADLHPQRFFVNFWDELEIAVAERSPEERRQGPLLTAYIIAVVASSVILQFYFGDRDTFFRLVDFIDDPFNKDWYPIRYFFVGWLRPAQGTLLQLLGRGDYLELWVLGYWALWRVIGFLVIPVLAILLHPHLRFKEMGLGLRGVGQHLWVYGAFTVPVLVVVLIVSFWDDFLSYYPFYINSHRSVFDFAMWELFYIAQFFSLEFFFRGFMLQPLRRHLGTAAIFAMLLPYVMIHFGKPLPECFAAILAGTVLGTLALRTKSIWPGFLVHVTVAVSMDALAIWQVHWR